MEVAHKKAAQGLAILNQRVILVGECHIQELCVAYENLRQKPPHGGFVVGFCASALVVYCPTVAGTVEGGGTHKDFRFGARTRPPQWLRLFYTYMFEGIKKMLGDENAAALKKAQPVADRVNTLESEFEKLSDDALRNKTTEFKDRLEKGETLDQLMSEAFAAVREASKRTLGQRHYDVQIIGGAVLHNGDIAEMRTGEGKTLVATLPVYLNALTGKGVHVVTVNDYLSRRDAVWMGQIYAFLGMSVGIINHEISYLYDANHPEVDKERDDKGGFEIVDDFLQVCTRQEAYAADITYGTNNEFGFDHLRDNISYSKEELRQRTPGQGGYH